MQSIFRIVELSIIFISMSVIKASLTQIDLRAKYGQGMTIIILKALHFGNKRYIYFQVGTSFNDGKSCYRPCDGQTKTCYFEFHAQMYSTMNG